MRFRNIYHSPVYCSWSSSTLKTGATTTELPDLENLLTKILDSRGYDILLTRKERELISQILERADAGDKRDVKSLPGIDDPHGFKRMEAERQAKVLAKQQLVHQEREARRLLEESRRDRFPEDQKVTLDPKRLEGSPTSLQDIKRHNASL